jgi:hypothetical protein
MERQQRYLGKLEGVAVATIVGFALAALFYQLESRGQGCDLLNGLNAASWLVLKMSHPALLVGWQSLQAYVFEHEGFLRHLSHVVPSAWTLLCFVTG